MQQALRLPRHGLAVFHQCHVGGNWGNWGQSKITIMRELVICTTTAVLRSGLTASRLENRDVQHPGQILKKEAIQGNRQRQAKQGCDQVIAKFHTRHGERVIERRNGLQENSQDHNISDRVRIKPRQQPYCPFSFHLPQGIATDQANKPEGKRTRDDSRYREIGVRGNWGQSKIIIMRELVICTTAVLAVA